MGKTVNLAADGQEKVEVDVSTLTMVGFSQTGRHIMHYHTHADHAPADNADAPFDVMTVLRRLQYAKSGFVLCRNDENSVIVDPEKIDYLIVEPGASPSDDVVLQIGLPGMKTPHIIQTPAEDAQALLNVMQRAYLPLMQTIENGHTLLYRAGAVRAARFKNDNRTVVLDFDTAGVLTCKPMQRLGAAYTTKGQGLRADFETAHMSACPAMQTKLYRAIDGLAQINHRHGLMMVRQEKVLSVEGHELSPDYPGLHFLLEGKHDVNIVSLEFDTAQERDAALAQLSKGHMGRDGMGGMDGMSTGVAHVAEVLSTKRIEPLATLIDRWEEEDRQRRTPMTVIMPRSLG